MNWVEIAVGLDDHSHMIKPEDRVKVAMAIQLGRSASGPGSGGRPSHNSGATRRLSIVSAGAVPVHELET